MVTNFGDIEPKNCEWIRLHLYRMWQKSDILNIKIDLSSRLLNAYWGELNLLAPPEYLPQKWYGE